MRRAWTLSARLAWALLVVVLLNGAEAQEGEEKQADMQRAMILRRVLLIVRDGDSFQACEYVHSLGTPLVVAQRYSDLLQDLYWQEHDVPHMVMFGRAGIQYCLAEAVREAKGDAAAAKKLQSAAKTMAYHLAVNTWPGWDDQEVTLTASDTMAGFDAARLHLRLVTRLGGSDEVLANAHWLLGAHYLAAGQHQEALEALTAAAGRFRQAKKPVHATMAAGYCGIVKMTRQPTHDEGKEQLDKAVAVLVKLDTEEARSFVGQLHTAVKVLVK